MGIESYSCPFYLRWYRDPELRHHLGEVVCPLVPARVGLRLKIFRLSRFGVKDRDWIIGIHQELLILILIRCYGLFSIWSY